MCEFHWEQAKKRAHRQQLKRKGGKNARGQEVVAEPSSNETGAAETSDARKKRRGGGSDVSEGGLETDARASRKRRREIREAERIDDVSEGGQSESELDARALRKRRRKMSEDGVMELEQNKSEENVNGHLLLAAPPADIDADIMVKEPANGDMTRVLEKHPMEEGAETIENTEDAVMDGEHGAPLSTNDGKVTSAAEGLEERGATEASSGPKADALEKGKEGHVAASAPLILQLESASKQVEKEPTAKQPQVAVDGSGLVESLRGRQQKESTQANEGEQQKERMPVSSDDRRIEQEACIPEGENIDEKLLVEERIAALRAALEAEEKRLRRLSQQGSRHLTPTVKEAGSAAPE